MTSHLLQHTVNLRLQAPDHRLSTYVAESFRDFAGLLAVSGALLIAAWSWKIALLLLAGGIIAWPVLRIWSRPGGLGGFSLHLAASTALLAILASSLWVKQVEARHPSIAVSAVGGDALQTV